MKDHRQAGSFLHLRNCIQGKDSGCKFMDLFSVIIIFLRRRNADQHLLPSKTSGHFSEKFHIAVFGKIQNNFCTSGIDQFLDILCTVDISGCHDRYLRCRTDLLDPRDRMLMLLITGRKVKDQKFICTVVTVKTCQFLYIAVAKKISLSESGDRPACLQI